MILRAASGRCVVNKSQLLAAGSKNEPRLSRMPAFSGLPAAFFVKNLDEDFQMFFPEDQTRTSHRAVMTHTFCWAG